MYLVYRAPADKLTTAENNLTTLHNFFLFMNCTRAEYANLRKADFARAN